MLINGCNVRDAESILFFGGELLIDGCVIVRHIVARGSLEMVPILVFLDSVR